MFTLLYIVLYTGWGRKGRGGVGREVGRERSVEGGEGGREGSVEGGEGGGRLVGGGGRKKSQTKGERRDERPVSRLHFTKLTIMMHHYAISMMTVY